MRNRVKFSFFLHVLTPALCFFLSPEVVFLFGNRTWKFPQQPLKMIFLKTKQNMERIIYSFITEITHLITWKVV